MTLLIDILNVPQSTTQILNCGHADDVGFIIWSKSTTVLYFNTTWLTLNPRLSISTGGELTITNTTIADTGLYSCRKDGGNLRSFQLNGKIFLARNLLVIRKHRVLNAA